MITAIVLISTQRNAINEVAEELTKVEGISEVYSVTGNHDLVAIVRVKTNEEISDLVTNKLGEIEGIERTDTMLAFKAFSKHDLEAMFSL